MRAAPGLPRAVRIIDIAQYKKIIIVGSAFYCKLCNRTEELLSIPSIILQ